MGSAPAKVFAIALALALDVFAVSVGVGIRGAGIGVKIRIGIAFASAEIAMNLLGAGLGLAAGSTIGSVAGYVGFGALIVLGAFTMKAGTGSSDPSKVDLSRGWGLLFGAVFISLDSLGVGFSILYMGVPLVESLAIIGAVSVAATTLGLTLGGRVGARTEQRAAFLGGLLLVLTGAALILFKALHLG